MIGWIALATSAAAPRFTPCPDLGERVECGTLQVPLDHDQPEGSTETLAVARVLAPAQPARGAVWFVDGGPGDAGTASIGRLGFVQEQVADLDVYAFDHRGVNDSGALTCAGARPGSEAGVEIVDDEWPACIDQVAREQADRLPHLTVTQAARDVLALVDATAASDDEIYLWGISYGTFLVNRVLQVDDADRFRGVVVDGLVPADWSFAEFDASLDATGRALLARCADDDVCRSYLGRDPEAFAEDLHEKLADGHCAALGLDADILRLVSGIFLMVPDLTGQIPVVLARLDRCKPKDKASFVHLFDAVFPEDEGDEGVGEPPTTSQVAQNHLALSELWDEADPGVGFFEELRAEALFTTEVSLSFARRRPDWPVYAPGPLDGRWAETDVPMLMLHGTLDPTVQPARAAAWGEAHDGASQTLILLDDGGHVVVNEGGCALELYTQFLTAPELPLDASCVEDRPPLSFGGTPEQNLAIWGDEDAWEGVPPCGCQAVPRPAAVLLWAPLLALWWRRRDREGRGGAAPGAGPAHGWGATAGR